MLFAVSYAMQVGRGDADVIVLRFFRPALDRHHAAMVQVLEIAIG
ncbi:MAG: hypothetical protein V7606_72, partial [Burkholderiales bacterium]